MRQDQAGCGKTGQSKTRQDKSTTRKDKVFTWQVRQDRTNVPQIKTKYQHGKQDKARQDKVPQGKTKY